METDKPNSLLRIRRGRDLVAFLLSLLIALIVWGVMKLSASYRSLFHYQVEISSPMEGRVLKSVSKVPLTVRGTSSGFYLLRHKYSSRNQSNVLRFRVNPSALKPVEGKEDVFFLRSSLLMERTSEMLEGSVSIEEIVDDTLLFTIPRSFQKKVPVCLKTDITFAPQYMLVDRISLKPDSVLVSGQASLVENIDSVFTAKVSGRSVNSSLQGAVEIERIPGVEMSQTETVYLLKVGRYVERTLEADVEARNVPQGARMVLIPSSVKITFREEYGSKKQLVPTDFAVFADYVQGLEAESGKVKVQIGNLPQGVLHLSVEPAFVDRIIME